MAGSDALGLLAHPLETVPAHPRAEALKRIVALYHQLNAEAVVMGLPVRADGEEGTAAAKVKQFSEALHALLPQETMIYFQDEYRSTVQ
ncbi:RuvX/YqgF family protein, partial [Lacticaseibacillus paracasei]